MAWGTEIEQNDRYRDQRITVDWGTSERKSTGQWHVETKERFNSTAESKESITEKKESIIISNSVEDTMGNAQELNDGMALRPLGLGLGPLYWFGDLTQWDFHFRVTGRIRGQVQLKKRRSIYRIEWQRSNDVVYPKGLEIPGLMRLGMRIPERVRDSRIDAIGESRIHAIGSVVYGLGSPDRWVQLGLKDSWLGLGFSLLIDSSGIRPGLGIPALGIPGCAVSFFTVLWDSRIPRFSIPGRAQWFLKSIAVVESALEYVISSNQMGSFPRLWIALFGYNIKQYARTCSVVRNLILKVLLQLRRKIGRDAIENADVDEYGEWIMTAIKHRIE
ncbi:hypothetical protein ZIOFF_073152 [Zingiber officinale]|uniref:Uncharacterized protein n=1 Tax=Zingiber officinale TaxID=94328 RepID=A0A8J5EA13_ZINOF|nr:hypothetical protein ZIOFF_073152 [Zingiber officinale]